MANAGIGWKKNIDNASLTAGNQAGSLLVGNLKTEDLAEVWLAPTNSTYIVADFGSDIDLDGTGLFGTNLTANATRRVRVSTEASGSAAAGDAHDSGTANAGVDPNYGTLGYIFDSRPVNGRYLRIDLADSSLSEIKAGRWFAGAMLVTDVNVSYGWTRSIVEDTERNQTPGGQTHANRGAQRRAEEYEFQFLTQTEAETFDDIMREVGLYSDLWFVRDMATNDFGRQSLWAQFRDLQTIAQPFFERFRTTISLIERK